MNFIEILRAIKDKIKGLMPELTAESIWKWMDSYNITPKQVIKFLVNETISIKEIVPFLNVIGLTLTNVIDTFVDIGTYYNEIEFIDVLKKTYSDEQIMDAYRNSSLDTSESNRILKNGLNGENIRECIYAYINQSYKIAEQTEQMLMEALNKVENIKDGNVVKLTKDVNADNTEMIVDYLEGLRNNKR